MQLSYGTLPGSRENQQLYRARLFMSRAGAAIAVLAVLALVGAASQLQAGEPGVLAGKDLNTYSDWLKTLNGPASYTGIGEETSDFGESQHNSKKGMRELVPGALPADAKIAQMQGADFVDDVVSHLIITQTLSVYDLRWCAAFLDLLSVSDALEIYWWCCMGCVLGSILRIPLAQALARP